MSGTDILRLALQLTYLGSLAVALRLYARNRSVQARWLVVLFGAIDVAIVVGLVRGVDADPLPDPWGQLLVVVLLAFPWGLLRFADSMVGLRPIIRRIGDLATIALALFTLVPGVLQDDPDLVRTGLQDAYLGTFLLVWGGQTIGAGIVLWRSRRGQAGVVRHRLGMLAGATVFIGLTLFASVGGEQQPDTEAATEGEAAVDAAPVDDSLGVIIGQWMGALSGVLFLVGFAPPRLLRSAWRHDDERNLYDVAVGFLTATSVNEVHDNLLPGLRSVLGAPAVALLSEDGTAVAVDGEAEEGWVTSARRLHLHDRDLAVKLSARMPLLGEDEQELIDRLGLLTALATDRARLIVSERQAREHVEDGNRKLSALNEELESFLYSTSHDLKNPVIALLGYISLLRSEFGDQLPTDAGYYLERMAANSRQMESLINDLLELSRVGRVETAVTDVALNEVIDELAADLSHTYPDAQVTRGDLPVVTMSVQRAMQLFDNLITNACRYAGHPDVEIAIRSELDRATESVVIRVQDNGGGIPTDQHERIFGMFERLHLDVEGGTGMGLAICRRIVEHMGGTIAVVEGSGATFEIRLPAIPTQPDQQPVPTGAIGGLPS